MREQGSLSGWQLDQDSAGAYERYLVPRFFRRWAERLVAFAGVAPGDRVLDAGCGTGIVARTAAQAVDAPGWVTGLDLNEGMLAEARRQDAEGRVEWTVGGVERMPFEDGAFDVVLCQQVLQFLPDRAEALAELHRVCGPGGRVALAVLRALDFNHSYERLAHALDRHAGSDAGDMMRSPFAGPDAATLRAELAAAGFRDSAVRHDLLDVRYPDPAEFLRQEAASSPLAGPLGEMDGASTEVLLRDLDEVLAPYVDDEGVAFPMETYLVRAYR